LILAVGPRRLAKLRNERCRNDQATIALALQGNWREDHLFALKQAVDAYRFNLEQLAEVDRQIETRLRSLEDRSQGPPPKVRTTKKKRATALGFDARGLLYRMAGMDLTEVNGLDASTVLTVISGLRTARRRHLELACRRGRWAV
jgi:transposase